jgi:diguanylate cyclase (GGDEF)-like protein
VQGDPARPAATIYFAAAGLMLVASVIESSFLLAYRDSLTGLPGRRALNDALERLAGHYTLAMIDVDHFKRVNDTYGHDVGDQVLRLVAARLAGVGAGGTAYRYGGEEFAIVFPSRPLDAAVAELNRIRETVASRKFNVRGLGRRRRKPSSPGKRRPRAALDITVSIGAADAAGRGKPDDVIRAADRALYKAKEAGRNRVEIA